MDGSLSSKCKTKLSESQYVFHKGSTQVVLVRFGVHFHCNNADSDNQKQRFITLVGSLCFLFFKVSCFTKVNCKKFTTFFFFVYANSGLLSSLGEKKLGFF